MENFRVLRATGRYVILKPLELGTILQFKEMITTFEVLFVGENTEVDVHPQDIILVLPGSVEETRMFNTQVYFVRDTDILAIVNNGSRRED